MKRRKVWSLCTNFVEHSNKTLALRFVPAHLFPYQLATTPSWVRCIEHEHNDVGLVDDFVAQHADVVSLQLLLRLVDNCRRRVAALSPNR